MRTVTVICDDSSHNDDRKWTVARIDYREDPQVPGKFAWVPNMSDLAGADPLQLLVGDDHMTMGEPVIYDAADGPREDRARWTLKCNICQRNVARRPEKFEPLLDTLADHGIGSISLAALAARV